MKRQLNPYQRKQETYDRERVARPEYPHRHRRYYPIVKNRFQRMERHLCQQLMNDVLVNENQDVSNALLQTVSLRCRGPKKPAPSLREVVELKLERRAKSHGARKRRQGLPCSPRSLPEGKH